MYAPLFTPPSALSAVLLLLTSAPGLWTAASTNGKEPFPVRRPLVNLHEAALQSVGRDGPRYPDDGFLRTVRACRVEDTQPSSKDSDGTAQRPSGDCSGGYAILTMANDVAMQTFVPLLLESLQRIEHPSADETAHDLARHTTVMGVTHEAYSICSRLRRRYHNACIGDSSSGLYDGDNKYPDHKALAFGMVKLKYIVNALTTDTAILYVDADVVFLRNPFPALWTSTADIAVATAPAPCGSQRMEEEETQLSEERAVGDAVQGPGGGSAKRRRGLSGGRRSKEAEDSSAVRYSTGITFYRSTPGALRCAYSLLLDMSTIALANPNATVWEQERFAAFVPMCAEALGLGLWELPADQFVTSCDGKVGTAARGDAVVVHATGPPGGTLKDRASLLQNLLGIDSQ